MDSCRTIKVQTFFFLNLIKIRKQMIHGLVYCKLYYSFSTTIQLEKSLKHKMQKIVFAMNITVYKFKQTSFQRVNTKIV